MSTPQFGPGIEITGRMTADYAADSDPRRAGVRRPPAARLRRPPRRACSRAAACGNSELDAGKLPDFLPETRAVREADWTCAPVRRGYPRSPRRDHRSGRSQDDHQRAQFRRQRVHGRLRGCQYAEVGQQHPGPHQPARRDPAPDRLRLARGQGLPAQRQAGDAVRAPARLASSRKARPGRRRADLGRHVRLCALLLSQRRRSSSPAAAGPTSICRSWKAISRRGCGTTSSCWRRTSSACRGGRSRRRC